MQRQAHGRYRSAALIAAAFLAIFGLSARLYLLSVSGNLSVGPLSGTGDQVRYQTLAESVFRGDGFTYARQPTALRAPAYPILLAALHLVFGSHYFLAMRILQLTASLLLAFASLRLAKRLFGEEAGLLAGGFALALPTLIFIENELQTEALAALLTGLFLLAALDVFERQKSSPVSLGIYSGLSALLRFNEALLVVFAVAGLLLRDRSIKRAVIVGGIAGLIVLPWLIRNEIAFHGRVLYSTHGGINLLEGVLTPQGRAQADEAPAVKHAVGWEHADIETNTDWRLRFPSEDVLNRQARAAAWTAWLALDWKSRVRLLYSKVVWFWLGTDQLLSTASFAKRQRYLRAAGVIIYWSVLSCALLGWRRLFDKRKDLAWAIALYCFAITLAHLPFVMNTRLRIPFIDPLLVVLAGGGVSALFDKAARLISPERYIDSTECTTANAI